MTAGALAGLAAVLQHVCSPNCWCPVFCSLAKALQQQRPAESPYHFPEGESSVVEEVSVGRVQAYGMAEIFNCTLIVPAAIPSDAPVVVSVAVLGVHLQSLSVVLYSPLIIPHLHQITLDHFRMWKLSCSTQHWIADLSRSSPACEHLYVS